MGRMVQDPGGGLFGRLKLMGEIFTDAYTFDMLVDLIAGKKSNAQFEHQLARYLTNQDACLTNSASQNYEYQGIKQDMAKEVDPHYPRTMEEYVREAREKGWMPVSPDKVKPRAWVT
jgi:hypothetical protein